MATFTLASQAAKAETTRRPERSIAPDETGSFIVIDREGMVTIYSGKVELGTGAVTAIAQIAAEELSVPLNRVTVIQGDTAITPNQGPTYSRFRAAACRSVRLPPPPAKHCLIALPAGSAWRKTNS